MLINAFAVGCGGFLGAALRYLFMCLVNSFYSEPFPLATFLINLIGCFLMGLFSACIPYLWPNNTKLLLFATTGLLGGFTTLSAFGLETNGLFEEGQYLLGSGYVAGTLGVCLGGVFLGRVVGRALMNQ